MNEQGWIEHGGGECPVAPATRVQVRTPGGYESGPLMAGAKHLQKFWRHDRSKAAGYGEHDIIAYRIVEPGK